MYKISVPFVILLFTHVDMGILLQASIHQFCERICTWFLTWAFLVDRGALNVTVAYRTIEMDEWDLRCSRGSYPESQGPTTVQILIK